MSGLVFEERSAFQKNFQTALADKSLVRKMNRHLANLLVAVGDQSHTLTVNGAFRNGWLTGYLSAHGTGPDVEPDEEDDGAEDAPEHSGAPTPPSDVSPPDALEHGVS